MKIFKNKGIKRDPIWLNVNSKFKEDWWGINNGLTVKRLKESLKEFKDDTVIRLTWFSDNRAVLIDDKGDCYADIIATFNKMERPNKHKCDCKYCSLGNIKE